MPNDLPAPGDPRLQISAAQDWLEKNRQTLTIVALALGAGLIIGFKLAGGVERATGHGPDYHSPDQPCAGCREREIRRKQAADLESAKQRMQATAAARTGDQPPAPTAQAVTPNGEVFDHTRVAPVRPPLIVDLPPE